MVKRKLFLTFFLLLSTYISSANAANIRVYVDRQNINASESFNLVFEAEGSVDTAPDFSPLNVYFDILSKNQSSNMTIVNGDFNRKTVWTLVLLAKQAGTYALPAIAFGNDNSPSLQIKIHKASSTQQSAADKNLFLEAGINQTSVYVQAQLIYTVKLFRAVDIQNASLTEPELSDADAIVEKLGDDKRFQITRNGVRFAVIERRYAIFPQQSGKLTIKPVEFKGQVVAQRRSFFDTAPFNSATKRIYSKQIDIDVNSVPSSYTNKNWLPSSEIKLLDEWPDNVSFKVGDPVTRTITIVANGLTAAQLPVMAIKNISGIKQYPDQPTLNDNKDDSGIIGIRQEKIALIPTQAGSLTLPELNISWWNTKTNQIAYARIDAKEITVIATTPSSNTNNIIEPIETLSLSTPNTTATIDPSNFWFYSSIVLFIAWLSTLILWLKKKPSQAPILREASVSKTNIKNISKKIKSACHQNNKKLCKTLLIEWANQQWPDDNVSNLDDIATRVDADLRHQILTLNKSMYSHDSKNWDSSELLTSFEQYKGIPAYSSADNQYDLKKLHKLV